VLKNLGELLLADAKYDQANQALQDSSEILADLGILDQRMDNYRLLGEAALGQDDIPTALDWERKALNISTEMEDTTRELATVQRGELLRFRGMLACHREDWISSQKYLRESKMIFQHLGSRFYQGRVAYQLGRLAELQGDQASSIRRYQEAVLHFQSVGARREENRSEKALLCNEPVEKPRETM